MSIKNCQIKRENLDSGTRKVQKSLRKYAPKRLTIKPLFDKVTPKGLFIAPQVAKISQSHTIVQGNSDDNTTIPPDTMGAIGPKHILSVSNSQIKIATRTGTQISTATTDTFFNQSATFDPESFYDGKSNRFVATAISGFTSNVNKVNIIASSSSDPTKLWYKYSIPVKLLKVGSAADYTRIGFNSQWVVVTANLFNDSEVYTGVLILIVKKADLIAGVSLLTVWYTTLNTSNFSLIPSADLDGLADGVYLPQITSINSNGFGIINLGKINGTASPNFIAKFAQYKIPGFSNYSGNGGPQKGSKKLIDTGDFRILNSVIRNKILYTSHNIFSSQGYAGIAIEQFNTATPKATVAIKTSALMGNAATQYAFPSIAVTSNGHALIGYSIFSSTAFASAAYSTWKFGTFSMTTPIIYFNGLATYTKDFGTGVIRWGDFSNTVIDPVNKNYLWTVQEYAGTHNRWATVWLQLNLTEC